MKNSRIQRRVYELLSKAAASASSQSSSGQRELHFVFFRKPDCFLESEKSSGHVSGVHFERTVLKGVSYYTCLSISLHVASVCFSCLRLLDAHELQDANRSRLIIRVTLC